MTNGQKTNVKRQWLGIALLILAALGAPALLSYNWQDVSVLKSPPNSPPENYIGPSGAWFAYLGLMTFGYAAFLLPVFFFFLGILMLFRSGRRRWPEAVWSVLFLFSAAGLLHLHQSLFAAFDERFNIRGWAGGAAGWALSEKFLCALFGTTGANVILCGVFAGSVVMLVGPANITAAGAFFGRFLRRLWVAGRAYADAYFEARRDRLDRLAREEREIARKAALLEKEMRKQERLARVSAPEEPRPAALAEPPQPEAKPPPAKPAAPARKPDAEEPVGAGVAAEAKSAVPPQPEREWALPPLSLLRETPQAGDERNISGDCETTGRILKETLAEFGIECELTNIEVGPVVTRYELLPAPGIKVEKIAGLSNNLALALKATSVRVQAPIPGKGVVGVEVPNSTATKVYLREIMEGEAMQRSKAELPLILGKDVGGADIVADLTAMPHLLIAGATGSGKTVCMNSILAGLLLSRTPAELKLLLVDPKIVEFAVYKNLPHLAAPVITDPKKVPFGLRWAIGEMENRYKLFARAGVRNIMSYNTRASEAASDEGDMPARIPYIVIVIDELADLMMVAQAEVENYIARLAQLSRAVGIHMILATQRPSVNVITGIIKANFPSRISFQVAQKVDSRTILDTIGAEKLLGRGDMLFLPPGTSKLVRAQGALTSDEELAAIIEFWRQQGAPEYETVIKDAMEASSGLPPVDEDADEELIEQAIAIIRETRRASTSSLQRRLRIGYTRAARLMDILEQRGIVGPPCGSDPREILIDLDGEIPASRPVEPEEEPPAEPEDET